MKKKIGFFLFLLLFPIQIFAYSNRIIVGGETIGIEAHSKGIYVVGFYEVNQKKIAEEAGFQIGDIIKKINHVDVVDIHSLNTILNAEGNYEFEVLRGKKLHTISITLVMEDHFLKTGLFVKDQINGIGTLSYIDPETRVYGSLGHEILESSSYSRFQLDSGNIYRAEVSSIKKSINGVTGEKNAVISKEEEYGSISSNEIEGIFGWYTGDTSMKDTVDVASPSEIRRGDAVIRTVIEDDTVEEFNIKILAVDESSPSKNILFEITDQKLLSKTGGIIQGMSGSPILQNNKIIGVVNYVIVEEAKKGYGIFITKMLEEGDKILS